VTQDRAGATIGNGAAGQGLKVFDDYLYYATSTTIGRKGLLDNSPSYSGTALGDDFLSDGTVNLDQSQNTTATTNTYTTTTGVSENAVDKCAIVPTRDPIKEIDVYLKAKGTGNWTLVVHDQNNRLIGQSTVVNASLVATGNYQPFTFSTPLRIVLNNNYHFHLYSSVGDGTVATLTSSDFSTANYKEYFGILIADTDWHPMIDLNGLVIGNNNYLAFWDESSYNPNKIVLDKGYKVRALWRENEFVVAAAWQGSSIDSVQDGKLYYWDGIQTVFNYSKPVSEGLPNAGISFKNRTFTILGSSGNMYLGTDPFQRVQTIPTSILARGKKIEIAPSALTIWEDRVMIGLGFSTDDANFLQGIYGFGNNSDKYPEVLSYDVVISTGNNQGTNKQIGAVKAFGKDLYYGWKDSTTYGIDYLIKTATSATSGSWQSLIFDDGNPQKTELYLTLVISFTALLTGQSVTPKYQLDRSGSFTLGTTVNTVGSTRAEVAINARSKEIQFGFNIASSNGTFPQITGVFLEYDDLKEETYRS
ncbi:MAG TPA: hypothetical protein VF941_23440, partial [Clostridia bacterium]